MTLAAVVGGYAMATDPQQPTPHWLIWPLEGLLAACWGVIFWKLESPLAGLWAIFLLFALMAALGGVLYLVAPDGGPDWQVIPILGGVIAGWTLLLRIRRLPGAMQVVHALVWGLGLRLAAVLPRLALRSVLSMSMSEDVAGLIVAVIFEPLLIYLWVLAILRQWSVAWPLTGVLTLLSPIVGPIAYGKIAANVVGRGETLDASRLTPMGTGARPRGLVEPISDD